LRTRADVFTPWTFAPIGVARTVFREKYSIPRQPGLCPHARGTLELDADPHLRAALRGIDGFTHLWVVYVFHATGSAGWKPGVRAPRLGGAQKVGVLASRSPHRPNPIGLSVVELVSARLDHPDGPRLDVRGVDLLDGSPVLDVKPYLPYADSVPRAGSGWAREEISRVPVRFTRAAAEAIRAREATHPELRGLIRDLLSLDPRPAFQQRKMPFGAPRSLGTRWGFAVMDLDVKWEITARGFCVREVLPLPAEL
jgi:tRNA-Thr(GGU) m(6)t(6)A37 methyltransferase TsaA